MFPANQIAADAWLGPRVYHRPEIDRLTGGRFAEIPSPSTSAISRSAPQTRVRKLSSIST